MVAAPKSSWGNGAVTCGSGQPVFIHFDGPQAHGTPCGYGSVGLRISYSWRRAWIGSTCEARRAGTMQAAPIIAAKIINAAKNVNGSVPLIPATNLPVSGRAISARPTPSANPQSTQSSDL